MRKLLPNTKGFGLIAVLAFVVVLGVIGGGGAYVYHQNRKAKPAAKASTSKSSGTDSTESAPAASTTDPEKFKVSQLGIEVNNVPASIRGLTDHVAASDSGGTVLYFSTASLTALDSNCSAITGSVGSLERISGSYPPSQDYVAIFVKQLPGFWIGYAASHALCSSNDQVQAVQGS
ncbi:hypothetical protein ACEZDB_34220 [Streptacidiphilus sp. N1-3]|uniref:Uncharacterized protein n=1 Tax=Streptacidiphilus alkalitolerans TaxID=3342712 RepID=A0ABV6XCC7_9ACTN